MLSIGGWLSKIDSSADAQFFVKIKWRPKNQKVADAQFFAQNEVKTKKKVITFADAQLFWVPVGYFAH